MANSKLADLTIGTRGSPLALWQANWVKDQVEKEHQGIVVDLVPIQTKGDKILDTPLAMVGGKGLFVKELETALLDNSVDIAVHSMKDVPTMLPDGLVISVICEREDPRDAFIASEVKAFSELPKGARVGTSSLRRQAQILSGRPDVEIISIRGNVGTRLKKLESENLDAIILAAAGMKRMEMEEVVTEYLEPSDCLPAVAQGAMGIETRIGDEKTASLINFLNHNESALVVEAERAFLKRLEGGCQAPIAGYATLSGKEIELTGLVGVTDGSVIYRDVVRGGVEQCTELGIRLAEELLKQGGDEILREAYGEK
ncbi:Porphobilinogen deaminase [hydrothermal vent metagenome]|uniref:Porphobilinogen deaminase n=1 Tax=hydrothermal vent metagenome TaxID=652676 RepID=A0A3B1CSZ0_9ZZZZ